MEEKVREAVYQALQQLDYEAEIQTLTEQVQTLEKQHNKDNIFQVGLVIILVFLAFATLIIALKSIDCSLEDNHNDNL